MKKTSFKNNKVSTIFEVDFESIVIALFKIYFKSKSLKIILPIFISSNMFFNFNSEIHIQNIKKESLQYEFCLATETYCMIQNENR